MDTTSSCSLETKSKLQRQANMMMDNIVSPDVDQSIQSNGILSNGLPNNKTTMNNGFSYLRNSIGEDEGIGSAVSSPKILKDIENDVFLHDKPDGIAEDIPDGSIKIPDVTETNISEIKRRMSSLFKVGRSPTLKRQDSFLGFSIKHHPTSALSNQSGLNSHMTNGLTNGKVMLRDQSIEEELQTRIDQLVEVTRQWKIRWRNEREMNQHLRDHIIMCEHKCHEILEDLQASYEEKTTHLGRKLTNLQVLNKRLNQQKAETEAELITVINNANEDCTKFQQELKKAHDEVVGLRVENEKSKQANRDLKENIDELKKTNDALQCQFTDNENELQKVINELEELKTIDAEKDMQLNQKETELQNFKKEISELMKRDGYKKSQLSDKETELQESKDKLEQLKKLETENKSQAFQLKAAEMQNQMYGTLLDIALSKVKFYEDNLIACRRYQPRNGTHVNKTGFLIRVNSRDPTQMSMESVYDNKDNDLALSNDLDIHSLSSYSTGDEASMDRIASIGSSVGMDLYGSDNNLIDRRGLMKSASTTDSVLRDDATHSKGLFVRRNSSADLLEYVQETPPMRAQSSGDILSDIRTDNKKGAKKESRLSLPVGFNRTSGSMDSLDSLVGRPSRYERAKESFFSLGRSKSSKKDLESKQLSSAMMLPISSAGFDSSLDFRHRQTLEDVKRKKSKSSFAHFATLQKLQKYRSVGDLIRGIRKSPKEGSSHYHSQEELNNVRTENMFSDDNNNNTMGRKKKAKHLLRRNTVDNDGKLHGKKARDKEFPRPQERKAVSRESSLGGDLDIRGIAHRGPLSSSEQELHGAHHVIKGIPHRVSLSSSEQELPRAHDRRAVSRESSLGGDNDVIGSPQKGVLLSSSCDDITSKAKPRRSGFIALRQRRDGFAMEHKHFKDISKDLEKKSNGESKGIFRKISRGAKNDAKKEVSMKS